MLPEDAFRLHISRLVRGEAASGRELEALVRAPNSPAILLHLVRATVETAATTTLAEAPAPAELLLCCQLLQKTLRRAPAPECDGSAAALLPLVRTAAAMGCGWTPVLTQLSLSVAVLLIRTETWTDAQLLPSLAAALGVELSSSPTLSAHAALLSILTLLGEEVHSPASRLSVAPVRVAAVRQELRHSAAAVLAAAAASCELAVANGCPRQVGCAMLCGRAWCAAGLVEPRLACSSALLVQIPLHALGSPQLAHAAAETLCAALSATFEAPAQAVGSSAVKGGRGGSGGRGGVRGCAGGDGGDESGSGEPASGACLVALTSALLPQLQQRRGTLHAAMVVAQGTEQLAQLVASIPPQHPQPDAAAQSSHAQGILASWLQELLSATEALPSSDCGLVLGTWPAIQEVADTAAPESPLSAILSQTRGPLLVALTRGVGSLPLDSSDRSSEDLEDIHLLREETRGVLRGAVMVDAASACAAVALLQPHADAAIARASAGAALGTSWQAWTAPRLPYTRCCLLPTRMRQRTC